MKVPRVVVTGIGAVSPLGLTFKETWSKLLAGQSGATTLEEALEWQGLSDETMERELKLAIQLPCQVASPVRLKERDTRTARFVQFTLMAGKEAIEHAQLTVTRPERIGVCIGSGMSGVREIAEAVHTLETSYRRLSPHFVPKVLANSAAGRLSIEFNLKGPNHSASTACAAGSHAIGDAMRCIQYGNADVMLAGGAESCIDPISMAGFCRIRALSTQFGPQKASRPFDKQRDGFVMGEGAAVIVLESYEHATQRNAPILAELCGYGLSGDANHITAPDPNGTGAERAMQLALDQAEIDATSVDYINAHATSTPKGDEIEAQTVERILNGKDAYVSSTKGHTGHLLGAAGAIEAAITVQSLVEQTVLPTLNLQEPDEQYRFQLVKDSPVTKVLNVAMSNSFGFGGTNASLVFRKP